MILFPHSSPLKCTRVDVGGDRDGERGLLGMASCRAALELNSATPHPSTRDTVTELNSHTIP